MSDYAYNTNKINLTASKQGPYHSLVSVNPPAQSHNLARPQKTTGIQYPDIQAPTSRSSAPSVRELAKSFEAAPAAGFAPPISTHPVGDTSPVRISQTQSNRTSTLSQSPSRSAQQPLIPGLPSLASFAQYQAEMQGMHNQRTDYTGAGMSGGNGSNYIPYDEGQRRMAEYRTQRGSDASSSRTSHNSYPLNTLIPIPPPHAYGQSGRSAESSPERGFSPAGSYRDDRSPSPSKMYGQQQQRPNMPYSQSYSSTSNLVGGAAAPGVAAMIGDRPGSRVSDNRHYLGSSRPGSQYRDNGSDAGSTYAPSVLTANNAASARLGAIDPNEIADDELDDPILNDKKAGSVYGKSLLGFGGGDVGSGSYDSLPSGVDKKLPAIRRQPPPNKKRARGLIVCFWAAPVIVLLGIIAGVVAVVLTSQAKNNKDLGASAGTFAGLFGSSSSTSSSTNNSGDDSSSSGDSGLTKSSPEITALLNNTKLHKVFPGIDYTPQNSQWPACLSNPPSQDNVTIDVALISQLASSVRLYGTDCNQTELVLEAITALGLESSLKVWPTVWLGTNTTTNTRQHTQMYDVLAKYGTSQIAGIFVGNEVIYREDMTVTQLVSEITDFKANVTKLYPKANLQVGTSDIGSSWTATLAEAVDIVGSNIHPFFGGVEAARAASWTTSYWQTTDVVLTEGSTGKQQIISETGWPSGGGNDCGSANCTSTTDGSVAGTTEMNTFMNDFVCNALTNGTQYFWFEAFDEPWKSVYNTATEQWETQWGLMDVDRKLKSGVTIPSCGGKTAS